MNFENIEQKLTEALNEVLTNDGWLLIHDINEPSISHRLALYLEEKFTDFNVDCEYNGNVDAHNGRKYIYLLKAKAEQLGMIRESDEMKRFSTVAFSQILLFTGAVITEAITTC